MKVTILEALLDKLNDQQVYLLAKLAKHIDSSFPHIMPNIETQMMATKWSGSMCKVIMAQCQEIGFSYGFDWNEMSITIDC